MTVNEALKIAQGLKYGPLPKPDDPLPTVAEAIGIIRQERRTCGFNWLTGEAAERALAAAEEEQK